MDKVLTVGGVEMWITTTNNPKTAICRHESGIDVQVLCSITHIYTAVICGQCVDISMRHKIIEGRSIISTNGDNL